MFYLTRDMAEKVGVKRPYMNLKTYADYKQRGSKMLKANAKKIAKLAEDEPGPEETET